MQLSDKMIVGSEEWCALPGLKIPAIKARIDSGAKTSSIHALNIKSYTRDKETWVNYEIFPIQGNRNISVRCVSKVVDHRIVKSSSGSTEKRYVIITPVTIGTQTFDIEMTLANRNSMGFRMLLGREAMYNRMLINPAEGYCITNYTKRQVLELYKFNEKERNGLKIGLLASNPNLYSNKRIIEAGEERGHNMLFLNAQHCYMKMDAVTPEVHYRGGNIVNDLDAIIPRIKPSVTFYGCALIRQFDSIGAYSLNSAEAITQSRDKLFSSQLFSKTGFTYPLPDLPIHPWIPII